MISLQCCLKEVLVLAMEPGLKKRFRVYSCFFNWILAKTPAPSSYLIRSEIREDTKKNSYTFGLSRECFKKVFLEHLLPRDYSVPGPGSYRHKEDIGKLGEKYTMRMKTSINIELLILLVDCNTKLNVPGPGTYKTLNSFTDNGKYFVSKFKDSGSNALRSKADRFGEGCKMIKIVPGPGKYNSPNTITKQGNLFISKFGSSLCGKFDHSRRTSVFDPKKCIYQT